MIRSAITAAYWLIVSALAFITFLASNFAGPSGTPTYFLPTAEVLAIGLVVYVIGLFLFRQRKA